MNFSDYKIPKEYTDKFKITQKDKKEFKNFWDNELILLNKMKYLSNDDIKSIHNALMYSFWITKAKNKEKYTPIKYKSNIYIQNN